MSAKGSKYARKHLLIEPKTKDVCETIANEEPDNGRILEVVYDDLTFLKTFDMLDLNEQIKTYRVLKSLAEDKSPEYDHIQTSSAEKLQKINERIHLDVVENLRYSLSPEEHHLIRMDCYGTVDARRSHLLSPYYVKLQKLRLKESLPAEKYNFDDAPAWQLFRQFKSFRQIELRLQKYMSQMRFQPDMLKVIGVQDFSDLIFKTFRKNSKDKKASFYPSNRAEFVMELATKKEIEIRKILEKQNIDERYINSLLNAMKLFGITDANHVIVTETYFTKRILERLKRAKIPCEQYRIGNKIPQPLINTLMFEKKGEILEARDENGKPLNKSGFPSFEVHHKIAVSEGGRFVQISRVNYKNNYLLVPSNVHADVLHSADRLLVSDGKEAYYKRLEFTKPNITFMYGLKPDEQFEMDWTNSVSYQQQEEQDQEYIVSYAEVMARLEENRKNFDNNRSGNADDIELLVAMIRYKNHKRK